MPPERDALSVSYVLYKYGALIKISRLKVGVMIGQWRLSSEAFSQSFNNSPTTFIIILVGPVCAHTLMLKHYLSQRSFHAVVKQNKKKKKGFIYLFYFLKGLKWNKQKKK